MASAHLMSAGVELPNQLMAPVHDPVHLPKRDSDDKKDPALAGVSHVDGDVMHEQSMPEGPPVSKWEEWAYYLYYVRAPGLYR